MPRSLGLFFTSASIHSPLARSSRRSRSACEGRRLKDGSPSAEVVGAEGHVLSGLDLSPLHVELHANAS
jgi:hypothetical protein